MPCRVPVWQGMPRPEVSPDELQSDARLVNDNQMPRRDLPMDEPAGASRHSKDLGPGAGQPTGKNNE